MTVVRALVSLTLLAGTPAVAQVPVSQPRPGAPAVDIHRYQAEQHRLEMDRLRTQADQREALARQLALETRLNRGQLEAARRPPPMEPLALPALRSPEEERANRLSATERRRSASADLGQIDAWLDRAPD